MKVNTKLNKELLNHFLSKRTSIEARIEKGKAIRSKVSRESLGEYKTSPKRKDPVAILEQQGKSRLKALVPIRYARMLASPFAFLRGAAAIMAADLANSKTTGIKVQVCGDMHLANFGIFASAERNMVFGINDFDETIPGPWEWDLKRLVTSIVSSGRFLKADDDIIKESVLTTVRTYRKKMKEYAYKGYLELWYSKIGEKDILDALSPSARKGAEKIMQKARSRTHMQVLDKLTDLIDDKYRLKENAPYIVRETHSEAGRPINEALGIFLESYISSLNDDRSNLLKNYRVVDTARKIVGVGSVGTRCWVVLLVGNNNEDPLFLQLKEASPSVLEPYLEKISYKNSGRRVVEGQRLIQGAPDIFLGWGEIDGIQFYVRQLRDMKGGVEFEESQININNLPEYGKLCAWSLALAHAKSGDAAVLAGYVGNSDELDQAMLKFAYAYADQTEKDYNLLKAAEKSKRIKTTYE